MPERDPEPDGPAGGTPCAHRRRPTIIADRVGDDLWTTPLAHLAQLRQHRDVTPDLVRLRNRTYEQFVALGRAPQAAEVAELLQVRVEDVLAGWRQLHADHALVLDATGSEIRMANPFSAVPTSYRVQVDDRWWYANCAWDAFGICAALHADGRIETSCADCHEPMSVAVRDQVPDEPALLFHCLVPAVQWWDDIVFT